jgi:hypothetical protein
VSKPLETLRAALRNEEDLQTSLKDHYLSVTKRNAARFEIRNCTDDYMQLILYVRTEYGGYEQKDVFRIPFSRVIEVVTTTLSKYHAVQKTKSRKDARQTDVRNLVGRLIAEKINGTIHYMAGTTRSGRQHHSCRVISYPFDIRIFEQQLILCVELPIGSYEKVQFCPESPKFDPEWLANEIRELCLKIHYKVMDAKSHVKERMKFIRGQIESVHD